MILEHDAILAAIKDGSISMEPFDEKQQVQGASIDLCMGRQIATASNGGEVVNLEEVGSITLKAGDTAVATSREYLIFDRSHVARIGIRSSYARQGLHVTTGLQVDPGFEGILVVGMTNLTPKAITIEFEDHLLSLEIHKLNAEVKHPYKSPYQGKKELSAEDVKHVTDGRQYVLSDILETVRILSKNVARISEDADKRHNRIMICMALAVAFLSLLITTFGLIAAFK